MNDNLAIQLFEGKQVRIAWDEEKEKYYFAVADIVQALTDTVNPRDYIKKMLRRDPELKSKWGTICPPVEMLAPDGKHRKTQAADLEGVSRIIEAIPSNYAETDVKAVKVFRNSQLYILRAGQTYDATGRKVQ